MGPLMAIHSRKIGRRRGKNAPVNLPPTSWLKDEPSTGQIRQMHLDDFHMRVGEVIPELDGVFAEEVNDLVEELE
jgi:hypothetical protein